MLRCALIDLGPRVGGGIVRDGDDTLLVVNAALGDAGRVDCANALIERWEHASRLAVADGAADAAAPRGYGSARPA